MLISKKVKRTDSCFSFLFVLILKFYLLVTICSHVHLYSSISLRGLVMYLLNKGADPTIQNSKGETVMSLLSNYSLDLLDGKEGLLRRSFKPFLFLVLCFIWFKLLYLITIKTIIKKVYHVILNLDVRRVYKSFSYPITLQLTKLNSTRYPANKKPSTTSR